MGWASASSRAGWPRTVAALFHKSTESPRTRSTPVSAYPTNPALESAIVANADEDTPRLVYADWLDENGDPDRAEFIRVQCRLADLSPAEPDWIDLTERQDELIARLKHRLLEWSPKVADRFYFGSRFITGHEEPFRRGFPYFIDCQLRGAEWTTDKAQGVIREMTRLVKTTTIRGFQPYELSAEQLGLILAAPVANELRGLAIRPPSPRDTSVGEYTDFYRLLTTSPSVRRVQQLFLYDAVEEVAAGALAQSEMLRAIRRLTISFLNCPKRALTKLTRADWFGRLRHARCYLAAPPVAATMVPGLGRLPDLHTLELQELPGPAVAHLAAGRFPALARLIYAGALDLAGAQALAGGRFPELRILVARGDRMKNDGFQELLRGQWFDQLRALDLASHKIGDRGISALAAHPVARSLRILRLGDNAFGPKGLMAIAKAFPALTTLDLGSSLKRKATPQDLARFLTALACPHLRHLNLAGWPLGDEGAKALAANAALANLTRLDLSRCAIGDEGAKALLASPHLQNLVELQLSHNAITTGADALADPGVMPHLGELWLSNNTIPKDTAAKIGREGLYAVL